MANNNIILGTGYLSGDGDNEGILVDTAGRVGIGGAPFNNKTLAVSSTRTSTSGAEFGNSSVITVTPTGNQAATVPSKAVLGLATVPAAEADDVSLSE